MQEIEEFKQKKEEERLAKRGKSFEEIQIEAAQKREVRYIMIQRNLNLFTEKNLTDSLVQL